MNSSGFLHFYVFIYLFMDCLDYGNVGWNKILEPNKTEAHRNLFSFKAFLIPSSCHFDQKSRVNLEARSLWCRSISVLRSPVLNREHKELTCSFISSKFDENQITMASAAVKPGSLTSLQFHSSLNKQLPLFDSLLKPLKLKSSRFSQFNLTLNTSRNASIIPTIRAQSSSVPGMR